MTTVHQLTFSDALRQTSEASETSEVLTPENSDLSPLDLLFAQFDHLITRPADIPRLNETILQLAVQGKLVPQDPADEPASVLLKRIAAEKARLVKEGKLRKSQPLPPVGEAERSRLLVSVLAGVGQ